MKQKTKKTLAKRVKITGTGKIMSRQIRTGHLKRKWSSSKKHRKNRVEEIDSKGQKKIIKDMLNI